MTTIRLFVIITILYFIQSSIRAQEISYGIKGGLLVGTPYTKPKDGDTGKVGKGPSIGAFLKYTFSKHFSVHAELSYSYKQSSFKTSISGDTLYPEKIAGTTYYLPMHYFGRVRGSFKNYYLDLPIMLAYKIGKRFNISLGPQISYLLRGNNSGTGDISIGKDPKYPFTTVDNQPFDDSSELNKWDYSVICGTDFEVDKRLFFELNGSYGLRSVYKDSYAQAGGTIRNIYFQLSAAFRLGPIKGDPDPEN